jgi:hypothetical protein
MPLPAELSTITTALIIQLTNAERAKAGLGQLETSPALSQAAVEKAQDMLNHDYFAHISPAGVTPWFWMVKHNYSYRLAGENLAIDFTEAEDVVVAWMNSPSHRANVLNADYVETGVGVLTGEFEGATSTVVVHMFGLPLEAAATTQEPAVAGEPAVLASEPAPAIPEATPLPAPTVTILSEVAQHVLGVNVTGQAGTVISLFVNSQLRAEVTLPPSGTIFHELALNELPDGEIVVRAQARDAGGRSSELSEPQIVVKDTQGPEIPEDAVSYIVSPATDAPAALVRVAVQDFATLTVSSNDAQLIFGPTDTIVVPLSAASSTLAFADAYGNARGLSGHIQLPSFYSEADTSYLGSPARFSQIVRRLTGATLVSIVILLSLAVAIRVQVQRPRMIAHTFLVLVLAAALLLV